MSNSIEWQQRYRRDFEELRSVFSAAAEHRSEREHFDAATGELGWVLYERDVMHDAVNRLRARLGRGPVTEDDVLRVERSASGHIDYAQKFALGCADLVHEESFARA
ncbi:hypothetical protein [Microbacterium sp. 13-71-7]|jgi:hypothetical protein|uniref:hypothetical protein n=1 Tax=Microbacterium sp. 13-71-7 TaxID=1970399 RepID=UPI000BC8A2F7|nr:hypothetical protein [Microbacterium sp. 13-71-7]OZB79884.1 MAG: hypothetical protein B7X32_20470 [Microbacterium sp. 13-71-7]